MMHISQRGIEAIKWSESPGGIANLEAYLDDAKVPTIGFGHTKEVQLGQRITPEEAEAFLRDDLADAEAAVNRYVTVLLSQFQYDAFF